jgi:sugar phosphate isomerase/epimerase
MDPSWAGSVARALASRGLTVAVLGCYVDLCGPDEASRLAARNRFSHNLSIAHRFGTRVVGSETPLSGGDPASAGRRLRETLSSLEPEARGGDALICIEPVWGHAVHSPRLMAELLRDIGSDAMAVILDPVNLVDPTSRAEGSSFAFEALELFGGRVAAVHVKDYQVIAGRKVPVQPGTGLMDWKRLAPAIAAAAPGAPFIVEEQDGPGFAAGLELLASIFG